MTKTAADRHEEGYQHWDMVSLGWKYNMDNIQAALLLPQLERVEAHWRARCSLVARYQERIAGLNGVSCPTSLPGVRHAHHLFTIWVDGGRRDLVLAHLQARGIPVVVNYRAIHLLTYFRERLRYPRGTFPAAERIGDETISLPLYPTMPIEHVDQVAEAVRQAVAAT